MDTARRFIQEHLSIVLNTTQASGISSLKYESTQNEPKVQEKKTLFFESFFLVKIL